MDAAESLWVACPISPLGNTCLGFADMYLYVRDAS